MTLSRYVVRVLSKNGVLYLPNGDRLFLGVIVGFNVFKTGYPL